MIKFHISPNTGEALPCSAEDGGCPYGENTIHGGTKEEVRTLYEAANKGNLFATQKKDLDIEDDDSYSRLSYRVPSHKIEQARNIIEKTNRRLARQGIEDRFEIEETIVVESRKENDGSIVYREYVDIKLNTPTISYPGHKFLAVVEKEEAGLITRTGRGVELNGWRPESQYCEHCGQTRARNKTYLIESPDGTRHQIGSTCVESYTGIKPEGLWALGFDPLSKLKDEDSWSDSYNNAPVVYSVDQTLALALAVSDNGENFVSNSLASGTNLVATSSQVYEVNYGKDPKLASWRNEMRDKAKEYLESGRVAEIKENITNMDGGSDYVTNLKTIAKGEWVSSRGTTTLISALASERKKMAAKKEKASWSSGHTAPVGTPVKGMKMTVVTNDVREVEDNYSYYGGTIRKSRVVFRDEEGRQVIWWASREIEIDEGDELVIKGGKVKGHGSYNGIDQTVLTNVKVEEKDPNRKEKKQFN